MEEMVIQHHELQKHIASTTVAQFMPHWGILDFHDLRATTAPWLKATRPVVEQGFLHSRRAAAEFVKNYRRAVLPDAEEMPKSGLLAERVSVDRQTSLRVMTSLKVTGPVWVANQSKPGMNPNTIPQIMRGGLSKSTGAVIRLVLNGGRRMVRDLAGADDLAQGVAGIADSDACQGCQFLTRPIMKSSGARKMDAVAVGHDFCNCSTKPIY
jgi:hypothetical protein